MPGLARVLLIITHGNGNALALLYYYGRVYFCLSRLLMASLYICARILPCLAMRSLFLRSPFSRRSCLDSAALLSFAGIFIPHLPAYGIEFTPQIVNTVAQQSRLFKLKVLGGDAHLRLKLLD